jgi:hypothetical protein
MRLSIYGKGDLIGHGKYPKKSISKNRRLSPPIALQAPVLSIIYWSAGIALSLDHLLGLNRISFTEFILSLV